MSNQKECSLCENPSAPPFDLCWDCVEKMIKQEIFIAPNPSGRKIVRDFNMTASKLLQEIFEERANGKGQWHITNEEAIKLNNYKEKK